MKKKLKRGFTLLEMLIVIGILSILIISLVVAVKGGTESARAAKCMANMRSLAAGCLNYAMAHKCFPLAGSVELSALTTQRSSGSQGSFQRSFTEQPGWISWNSNGAYRNGASSHVASKSWFTSTYDQDDRARAYCITNGSIWSFVSGNRSIYVCPQHTRVAPRKLKPNWSYVMNSWFGYDNSLGERPKMDSPARYCGNGQQLTRGDRILLLAEMPWMTLEGSAKTTKLDNNRVITSSGPECDCTLQYERRGDEEMKEYIGFNHVSGRDRVAHIVFADAHTEKLILPKGASDEGVFVDLTSWLCNGVDVTYDASAKRYKVLK